MQRRAWLLLSVSAAVVGFGSQGAIHNLVKRLLNRLQYDGLEGIVSYSSRVIAASRALESEREDRVFEDPLAAALAGKQALQEARARSNASSTSVDSSSKRKLGRIVIRTKFFDDAIMTALGQCQHEQYQPVARSDTVPPCLQVVLLGSGMDSRPWRLALPPGIAWFEVDQPDVLAAKSSTLRRLGAQVDGKAAGKYKYPLKAGSWTTVAADLQQPGWTAALLAAGLDPAQPTCWVAEGLLYYLQPDRVPSMLAEAASVSCPGSTFMASLITEESLAWLKQRGGRQQADSSSGSAGAGEGSSEQQQKGRSGQGQRSRGQSLTSKFIWGCPGDVGEYFGSLGWPVVMSPGWTLVAERYGATADYSPDPNRPGPSTLQCTFFAASGWRVGVCNIWTSTAAAYGWATSATEATADMSLLPSQLRPQDLVALLVA